MRFILVTALFAAVIAIAFAYPASEVEANNQELFNVNSDVMDHETVPRQARQFGGGFGRGYGGFGRGGFGGFGRGGYGGFGRGGYGGFGRGGYGGFGRGRFYG